MQPPMNGRVTPELMILLARLIVYRDRHGAEKCRRNGVGAIRKVLSSGAQIATGDPIPGLTDARTQADLILEAECFACQRCRLGRE